jgi:hypothetical protein
VVFDFLTGDVSIKNLLHFFFFATTSFFGFISEQEKGHGRCAGIGAR